ncbi:MAG TPA: sugar phosphate isomerase/epimerase [Gemmatimonadaceae bacterium]|jgi:sugar phosphate isomerase/epimerase|nr:sugar phosphate isomerase/epimerase [Gemmatimonadaceae bacterium]
MTSRRTFLETLGVATAAAALPGELFAGMRSAKLDAIGLQLYTVRSLMAKDVEGTLATVAGIGYREVEFAGYFNRDPAALRATLDKLKLTSPSCHIGLDAVETGFDATAAAAKTIGHKWVVVASVPGRFFQSIASLKELAQRFNAIGKRAKDAGLRYGYHNHNVEFKAVEGTVPLELLLSETDPALVDFEMDAYWVTQGGGDPLALINKYPGRFRLLHAKDASAAPESAMRDVGAGVIDWKKIFAERKKAGIEHVFVERDDAQDPVASITASYNFLHNLSF